MHVVEKQITADIFHAAQLPLVVPENNIDHVGFGGQSELWQSCENITQKKWNWKKKDCQKHNFQLKWKDETGRAWNAKNTTESLFKVMIDKAMPQEVQKHHVDVCRIKIECHRLLNMLCIMWNKGEKLLKKKKN